ncbi:MAG TPA: C25 family cysteine peptidase, partial [Pyrinomonadaceae bacterium]|nr:C25 family cysteine peptidase [Pyrinomonadaceae bacterium]
QNNFGSNGGGVVFNASGSHRITNSTISGNSSFNCGGIRAAGGTVSIANSTISGNTAPGGSGGGLCNVTGAVSTLRNTTVTLNSAGQGGGILNGGGTVNIGNTIVAGNSGTNPDISMAPGPAFNTAGYNLIGDNGGLNAQFPAGNPNANNDRVGVTGSELSANLAALANNGGPTSTHAFLGGSLARNNGSNANAVDPFDSSALSFDQRGSGFPRIIQTTVDIGAYEFDPGPDQTFNTSGNLPAGTYNDVTINSPSIVTLTGNITINGCLNVNSGATFNMGSFVVSGPGCFTAASGSTLGLGHADGISAGSTFSGNVQVTGTRTYSTGANYNYNGTTAQSTGDGLPSSVNNLTINNSSGVTLTNNVAVDAALNLTSGAFGVGTRTLTVNNGVSATGGSLTSGATGTVIYNQSSHGQSVLAADYGNLTFSNFNKTLASSGIIGITTNFSPGSATGHTVTGSTIEYHIAGLTGSSTTILPPTFNHYHNLNINQLGNTVGPTGLVVDNTLELFQGTFTSASDYHNITIGTGATLSLAADITLSGDWNNKGTFLSNGFKVTFDGTSNQSIGGTVSTSFATLAINNSGTSGNNIVSLAQNTTDSTLEIMAGVFSQGTSFNLTSGAVTVSSGATWRNLGTGDVTLSSNVANSGTIDLNANGTPCGQTDDILIRSSVGGAQRTWSGTGTFSMIDVDVQDQRTPALPPPAAILVNSGTDSGNNIGWTFTGTCASGTYTWIGGTLGVNTDWQVATNWSPTRLTPATGDVLIFDGNSTPAPLVTNVPTQTIAAVRLVNNNISVTLNAAAVGAPHTLTMSGSTGTDLQLSSGTLLTLASANVLSLNIASGSTASIDGQIIFQDAAHRLIGNAANAVLFHTGAFFTTASGFTGNAFGTGGVGDGTTNSVQFEGGSKYFHNAGLSPFGTAGLGPVAVFQTNSEAHWLTNAGFQASDRIYADLVVGNGTSQVDVSDSGSGNFEFNNLTVNSPGSGSDFSSLSYTGTGSSTITIRGNITSSGAAGGTLADVVLQAGSAIVIDKPASTVTFSNTNSSVKSLFFNTDASITSNTTLSLARVLQMGNSADKTVVVNGALNGGASGYVVGAVRQPSVPDGAYTFHVGTVLGYTPVALSGADSTNGDLTVRAVASNHALTTDAISLDEYWTLSLNSGTLTTALTFHYLDANVDGAESEYKVVRIEGSTIVYYPDTNLDTVANSAQVMNISGFSDWTLAQPIGPTAVRLTKFNASAYNDGVQLNWETGFEVDNLGYHLYRDHNGKLERVTPSIIAGSALSAGQGRRMTAGYTYSWFDPKGTPDSSYQLEAIDLDGSVQWAGPIIPYASHQHLRSPRRTKALLLDELASSRSDNNSFTRTWPTEINVADSATLPTGTQSRAAQQAIAAGQAVKIYVNKSGWYRLTQSQLIAAGLDPDTDARRLQLFVDGQEVPISLSTAGSRLNANDTLEFYGVPFDVPSTDTRVYWLVIGEAGKRMIARRGKLKPSQDNPDNFVRSFDETTELRERLLYFSNLLNGDTENIFGRAVTPRGTTQVVKALSIASESLTQPRLEVALQGLTDGPHRVTLQLNGTSIGELMFAGREHPVKEFSVNKSLLNEGNNTLSLVSVEGAADISLVDWVRLTYPRRFRATEDYLRFTVPGGQSVRIDNFSSPNVRVVDVTDPNSPTQHSALASAAGGSYAVTVQAQGNGVRTLLAFTEQLMMSPAGLVANQPSNWGGTANGADMLIITHRDFRDTVEPLAHLRRNQGLTVSVIDVDDIYDEFSYGAHTPSALKDFLASANANWQRKPRFLLLVGDSTWDPRNYLGQGMSDFVPSRLIDTSLMETASDDWFTDFSNVGMASIATGRLPVRSAAEASLLISKILSYEQERELNVPLRTAVMVADQGFETQSEATSELLPSSVGVQRINRTALGSDDLVRTRILDALNQGPMLVNYYGHGSLQVWTGVPLFDSEMAGSLTNSNRLSIFLMLTCLNGFAHDVYDESLSESLLKAQNGAVAVWASSGFTTPEPQFELNKEFYRLLFGPTNMRLGEAARTAKQVVSDRDVRQTWTLYGDPAMRVR